MRSRRFPPYVAVVGPGDATRQHVEQASAAGQLLAQRGWVVMTGGLGGVMAAVATGAREYDGTTVALLPGNDREMASEGHAIVIPTGLGEMRNALLVRCCDAVLAIGGSWGTLSEIALAARTGVPVVSVGGWSLPGDEVVTCASVGEAVETLDRILS
jgi:uncharacterized protein (TIGR00725 family)